MGRVGSRLSNTYLEDDASSGLVGDGDVEENFRVGHGFVLKARTDITSWMTGKRLGVFGMHRKLESVVCQFRSLSEATRTIVYCLTWVYLFLPPALCLISIISPSLTLYFLPSVR